MQKEITSASVIFFPFTRIRSRKSKICGEVKSPTFSFNSVSIDAVKEAVDPLPFVPAMCINCNLSCGLSKEFRREITFDKPGL